MNDQSHRGARRIGRVILGTALLTLLAGLGLPLINANRFQNRIRLAMEGALGRKVDIGTVRLKLLPAPAFQLHNVVIADDPSFGAEHFAYMGSLQARLRLRALWTGRIQLASLTLIDPSINLVKNAAGPWNFEKLLARAGAAESGGQSGGVDDVYFPYIGIDGGRFNFKFGDYKSVFYIQDVDAALAPPRDVGGRWRLRFAGHPARLGRALGGMGRVTGDGYLSSRHGVSMDLELENSPVGHLLWLISGRDPGIHGILGARVRLSGPLSDIQAQGRLDIGDVHRWNIMPSGESRLTVTLAGRLALPEQNFALEARQTGVRLRVAVRNYLSRPQWEAALEVQDASLAPLVLVAQHLGVALPLGLEARGLLSGSVIFPGELWPRGILSLKQTRLALGEAPPVELRPFEVVLDRRRFEVKPFPVRIGRETVQASAAGSLEDWGVEGRVSAAGLRLEAVKSAAETVRIPWLHWVSTGHWEGQLVYRKGRGQAGTWSASGTLSQARWQPPGLESPITIARARVRWDAEALQLDNLSGTAGESQFSGTYRWSESGDRCKLRIDELDLDLLDRALHPQREPSRWAILKRALRRGGSEATPSWLPARRIEGTVAVDSVRVRQWEFRNVHSALSWTGQTLLLKGLKAEMEDGSLAGVLRADFASQEPTYRLEASFSGVHLDTLVDAGALPPDFRGGPLTGKIALLSSGRRVGELPAGLTASGIFEGRSITVDNIERHEGNDKSENPSGPLEIRLARGNFKWETGALELTSLRMTLGRDMYEGRGMIGRRRAVLFEIASEGKPLRLVGSTIGAAVIEAP